MSGVSLAFVVDDIPKKCPSVIVMSYGKCRELNPATQHIESQSYVDVTSTDMQDSIGHVANDRVL